MSAHTPNWASAPVSASSGSSDPTGNSGSMPPPRGRSTSARAPTARSNRSSPTISIGVLPPSAPRTMRRSFIPRSAGRVTTTRRSRLAHASDPRSTARARPSRHGQGLCRHRSRRRGRQPRHAEWLALLLEREASLRRDKRLSKPLQYAKLRQQACVEDIDYRTPRGLDRSLTTMLVEGQWIDDHANLLICGPSGVGKSWLASALGNKACRDNRSVLYQRIPKLFADLALARGDGRHLRILRTLGRVDVLILDDWGLETLDAGARHDLLEILEERYGRRSTIVTSQIPVDRWHDVIGD